MVAAPLVDRLTGWAPDSIEGAARVLAWIAVVAGLTLASASSVAHDLYASVWRKGKASEASELVVVRIAALVIGAVAIAVGPDGALKLIDLGLTHMLENPWKQVTKRIKTQEYADEITLSRALEGRQVM